MLIMRFCNRNGDKTERNDVTWMLIEILHAELVLWIHLAIGKINLNQSVSRDGTCEFERVELQWTAAGARGTLWSAKRKVHLVSWFVGHYFIGRVISIRTWVGLVLLMADTLPGHELKQLLLPAGSGVPIFSPGSVMKSGLAGVWAESRVQSPLNNQDLYQDL